MSSKYCRQVIVRDERGQETLNRTSNFFNEITLKTERGKTIIEKKGLLGVRTYIPAMNEAVEAKNWWGHEK